MLDVKFKLAESHSSAREWMAPAPLRQLFWNATYACNHRCGICFTGSGAARAAELTTDEALAMLEQARRAGVLDVILSGGEPFMRPDLPALLAWMGQAGLTARIATNGTLLTPELLDDLRRNTRVKSFQVSLDSLRPEVYAQMHGTDSGDHRRALRALDMIRERGFHTTAAARLTPDTLPEIPALLDRAAAEGWATFTVHLPVPTNRTQGAFSPEADLLALLEPAFRHFFAMSKHWMVEIYIPWAPWHGTISRLAAAGAIVHVGCRAGRDRLAIHPSGDVSPCVCMEAPAACIGNVRRDELAHLFETAPACDLFRHPAAHGICADCGNVAVCGGGCRASAFAATGRLDGTDPACPLRRARAAGSGAGRSGRSLAAGEGRSP